MTIVGPSIDSLDVASGAVKDTITVTGTFFGSKKGTVKVETK